MSIADAKGLWSREVLVATGLGSLICLGAGTAFSAPNGDAALLEALTRTHRENRLAVGIDTSLTPVGPGVGVGGWLLAAGIMLGAFTMTGAIRHAKQPAPAG